MNGHFHDILTIFIRKENFFEKTLASLKNIMYTNQCCGMIAMKREVAVRVAGFPWSECQVRKLTTSHCTSKMSDPIRNDVFKL